MSLLRRLLELIDTLRVPPVVYIDKAYAHHVAVMAERARDVEAEAYERTYLRELRARIIAGVPPKRPLLETRAQFLYFRRKA